MTTSARLNRLVFPVPRWKQSRSGKLNPAFPGMQINELFDYMVLRRVVNPRLAGGTSATNPLRTSGLYRGLRRVLLTLEQMTFTPDVALRTPRQISLELHRVLMFVRQSCLVLGTFRCLKAPPTLLGIDL